VRKPVGPLGFAEEELASLLRTGNGEELAERIQTGKWPERTVEAPNPPGPPEPSPPVPDEKALKELAAATRDYWRLDGKIEGRREGREEGFSEAKRTRAQRASEESTKTRSGRRVLWQKRAAKLMNEILNEDPSLGPRPVARKIAKRWPPNEYRPGISSVEDFVSKNRPAK
jgi:hypothetical protein